MVRMNKSDGQSFFNELVTAIQGQQVAAVAQRLLNETPGDPAARALASCAAISAEMRQHKGAALGALRSAGVTAEAIEGPEDRDAAQFHAATLRIARSDLPAAVAALQAQGFQPPLALSPARLAVLRRAAPALTMLRFADSSARLTLALGPAPTALPAALRPGMRDLAVVDLPDWAAGLYFAIRPVRALRDRLSGQYSTVSESDLLGTPDSLVAPLFEAMALGACDVFYDLGCGDGRLVEAAAQLGCRAVGVEMNPGLAAAARRRLGDRAQVIEGAIQSIDLSDATTAFMFLPKHLSDRLLPQVLAALPPGARLFMHEQQRPSGAIPPDHSAPIFGSNGMTVLHRWTVSAA